MPWSTDVTEDSRVEDLPDDIEPGEEEGPQGLRAEQATIRGELGVLRGLGGVQRERLLHQRVLAGLEGEAGAVQGNARRDGHGLGTCGLRICGRVAAP